MKNAALQALADHLAADGRVDADKVFRLRQQVFADGKVTREEADALVDLEARVANSDAGWMVMFSEAICDHALKCGETPNVDDDMAAWLSARLGEGAPRTVQAETAVKILERCDSAPEALYVFARERIAALVAGRAITASDVELIRHCLYACDAFVGAEEARWLFAIDAESDGRANDPAWTDLFVKAQLNHLTGRQPSTLLDRDVMVKRAQWLRSDTPHSALRDVANMFSGGFRAYLSKARDLGMRDKLECYYEATNANAEEDSELTSGEKEWAVSAAEQDGKLTANERALLAALDKSDGANA